MPRLSVVIVNYKVPFFVEQALISLQQATRHIPCEVFVVDNNSQDGSVEYLEKRFPQVSFLRNTQNSGFAVANNQAIRLAKGEYILLLNPDTVIGEQVLDRVIRFFEQHEEAGAVGVRMLDGSGRFLPESKRGFPSLWASFCKIFGIVQLFPARKWTGGYYQDHLSQDEIHPVPILAGAFMCMPRRVLDKCGLLDESFFMYGEDIDLSYRITRAGYQNYYLPERILHYKGESTATQSFQYVLVFYKAMRIFYRKHFKYGSWLLDVVIHFAITLRTITSITRRLFPEKKKRLSDTANLPTLYWSTDAEDIPGSDTSGIGASIDFCLPEDADLSQIREYILMHHVRRICFIAGETAYEEMLCIMENLQLQNVSYLIYHPQNGTVIGSSRC